MTVTGLRLSGIKTKEGRDLLMHLEVGATVEARYRIDSVIGEGATSTVYQAYDLLLNNEVAIKVLDASCGSGGSESDRFSREAKNLSRLDHANIVRVLRHGFIDEARPFIVMELLSGKTLRDYIVEKGVLSLREAVNLALQIAQALLEAHTKAIIHRDLKPENIMLLCANSGYLAKLLDFGLSKTLQAQDGQSALTSTAALHGTIAYMSPEQCTGKGVDELSDVYSLGCIFFEMLTGFPPFRAESPGETMLKKLNEPVPRVLDLSPGSGLPKQVDGFIAKCLAKEKKERYHSISDCISALKSIESLDNSFRFKASSKQYSRPVRALPSMLLGLTILFIAFGLVLYFYQQRSPSLKYANAMKELPEQLNQFVEQGKEDELDRYTERLLEGPALRGWTAEEREELYMRFFEFFREKGMSQRAFRFAAMVLESAFARAGRGTVEERGAYIDKMELDNVNSICDYLMSLELDKWQLSKLHQIFVEKRNGVVVHSQRLMKPALLRVKVDEKARVYKSKLLWDYLFIMRLAENNDDLPLAEKYWRKILDLNKGADMPREIQARALLGLMFSQHGRLPEAREHMNFINSFDTERMESDETRHDLLLFRNELAEAEKKASLEKRKRQ